MLHLVFLIYNHLVLKHYLNIIILFKFYSIEKIQYKKSKVFFTVSMKQVKKA